MEYLEQKIIASIVMVIIKSDNSIWMCGYNQHGQLGDGTTEDRITPVEIVIP